MKKITVRALINDEYVDAEIEVEEDMEEGGES